MRDCSKKDALVPQCVRLGQRSKCIKMRIKEITRFAFRNYVSYSVNVTFLRHLGIGYASKTRLSTAVSAHTHVNQEAAPSSDENGAAYPSSSSDKICTRSQKKRNRKYSQNHLEELLNYFASNEDFKHAYPKLPQKLLKHKRTTPETVYLVDPGVAKHMVNIIMPYFKNKALPVLEVNPGFGYITKELLDAGVSKLRLFEPISVFTPYLERLQRNYLGEIEIIKKDFLQLAKYTFLDKQDRGRRVDKLFHHIDVKKWTDEPVMRIVGALPSLVFIKQLIMNHIMQTGIMALGRPDMYLVMSPMLYNHLMSGPASGYLQYRSSSVLFQLIFECYLLDKLPRKAFLPWEANEKSKKFSKISKIEPDFLYLVRVIPNEDFFQHVVPAEHLQPFWYFVRHHLNSRANRVIPCLEKWVPGCGPRLIVEGLNIYTQFGDLKPREILHVFKKFISWPEYSLSSFPASIENFFIKMETSEDSTKDMDENSPPTEDEDEEF